LGFRIKLAKGTGQNTLGSDLPFFILDP